MSALVALLAALLVAQPQDPRALPPPPTPVPRAPNSGPDDGPNTIRVAGGLAYRLSGAAADLGFPATGLSLAAAFERRYMVLDFLELGAAVNLFFDRFSAQTIGMSGTSSGLTHNTFVLLQTAAVRADRWRFSAGAGLGVTVSSAGPVQPVARGLLDAELTLWGRSALALVGGYTRSLTSPAATDSSPAPFGSSADVDLAYVYRF